MLLQIQGHHLPGRVWRSRDEYYDNVHVGIQVGKEPRDLVRADAESPSWTITIDVIYRGIDLGAVTTSRTIGPREVKSTSRVYVTPGRRSELVTDSWGDRPVAAEATTDTPVAASATPMRSFRNKFTTRRPE